MSNVYSTIYGMIFTCRDAHSEQEFMAEGQRFSLGNTAIITLTPKLLL